MGIFASVKKAFSKNAKSIAKDTGALVAEAVDEVAKTAA
ncbi:MAG: hypothetical protein RLZZ258_580, partial [Actinomycetota bacterium]